MTVRFHIDEIVERSSVGIKDGRFCFDFICPRCEKKQRASLSPEEAVQGLSGLDCANTKECGEGNMTMNFSGIGTALLPLNFDDAEIVGLDASSQGQQFVCVLLANNARMDICLGKVSWGEGRYTRVQSKPLKQTG